MEGGLLMLLGGVGGDQSQNQRLAEHVAQQLAGRNGNFTVVLTALKSAVHQVEAGVAVDNLLRCALWCSQHGNEASATPVVQHLLLEAIPSNSSAVTAQIKQLAVELLITYCSSGTGKLASKVASSLALTRDDVGLQGWQVLTAAVPIMLQQPSSYKPAVFLMMQFEGLDECVDRCEVLTQLVADGQDTLAQQWATSLGRDYQVTFVEACIALDRLKPAARAVRQLGLSAEFPNVEAMYRQRSLTRLMNKRLWSVAQSYAGNDAGLQTQLVRGMADGGELLLAEEFRKAAGLPPDTLAPPDPAEIAAQEAARRAAYMQLDLRDGAVLWVDDAASCLAASQQLAGCSTLGLDVEWKPSHVAGVSSPAALLQVGTHTSVVLFDLLQLCTHHQQALESCLGPLLSNSAVLKLGFEVAGDLAKLANSWPAVEAFRVVVGVLDLRPLWVAYGLAARHQGGSARALSSVGLSTLCQKLLGKPLDKSQQMSDWSARPLSQRQQQYAALDAFVLPQLYDVLRERLGDAAAQQLVMQHTKTVTRPSAVASTTPQSQQQQAATPAAPTAQAKASRAASEVADRRGASSSGAAAASHGAQDCCYAGPVGDQRVLEVLQQHGLQDRYKRLHVVRTTGSPHTTAWDTAAALGVPTSSVVKTMTLLINQQPHLVVTRGDQRIDMHKLATLLGIKRRTIVIAPEETVLQLTGFTSGVPPIGHASGLRVIVDKRLADHHPTANDTAAASSAAASTAAPGCMSAAGSGQAVSTSTAPLQPRQPTHTDSPASTPAGADVHEPGNSTPLGSSRGIVGAMSLSPPSAAVSPPQCPSGPDCSDPAAAPSQQAGGSSGTTAPSHPLLAVQCGPDAVLRLSFEELLQLAGANSTADVADAPEQAAALSTLTGSAAGTPVQQDGAPAQAEPKFLLDSMLGRLCRWLRALGVDAEFVEPGQQGQSQQQSALVQQVQEAALLQGRLFITCDQKLAMRRDVGGSVYLLNSNDAAEQLAELSRHFGIKLDESHLMSRCSACNAAAFQRITHQQAAAHVNSKLLELVEEFWQCGRCQRVFWMGPKSYAAINLLEGLFADGKPRPTPLQSLKSTP